MARPTVRFCKTPSGQRLAYTTLGHGPPVVCAARWMGHLARDWEDCALREFFENLANHHTVVRYDPLGAGLSGREREIFGLASEVEQLEAVVKDAGLTTLSLMGVASAGPTALAYAHEHPDRVKRLVLFGAYAHGPDVAKPEVHAIRRNLIRAGWGLGSRAVADMTRPGSADIDLLRMSHDQYHSANASMAAELFELACSLSARDIASSTETRTLVIHSEGNPVVPIDVGRQLAKILPAGEFLALGGDSHLPWLNNGHEIMGALHDFLGPGADPDSAPIFDSPTISMASIEQQEDLWQLGFNGRHTHVRHTPGMDSLALLFENPHQEIPCTELMPKIAHDELHQLEQDPDIVADARQEIQSRFVAMREATRIAEETSDPELLSWVKAEHEWLVSVLGSAAGAPPKRFAGAEERSAKAVKRRVQEALAAITAHSSELGEHLAHSITLGLCCSYRPDPEVAWRVS